MSDGRCCRIGADGDDVCIVLGQGATQPSTGLDGEKSAVGAQLIAAQPLQGPAGEAHGCGRWHGHIVGNRLVDRQRATPGIRHGRIVRNWQKYAADPRDEKVVHSLS